MIVKTNNNNSVRNLIGRYLKEKSLAVFVLGFALLAAGIGLSRIFAAQNTVYFTLSPSVQYANANDQRSVAILLDTYNQPVDGGSVTFVYDTSQLQFVSYGGQPSYVHVSVNTSQPGRYYFAFTIDAGAPTTLSLGSITLKANSLPSTQGSRIGFDPSNSGASSSGSAYPASYGAGAIVVYAAQPASSTTPPSQPQPTAPTTTSPTSPGPVTGPTVPKPATTAPPTQASLTPAPEISSNIVPPEFLPLPANSNNFPAPSKNTKKFNKLPLIIILVLISMGIAGWVIYYRYFRAGSDGGVRSARGLGKDLFDQDEIDEENIVVSPSPRENPEVVLAAAKKSAPPLARLHPLHILHNKPKVSSAEEPQSDPKQPEPVLMPHAQTVEDPDTPSVVTTQKSDEVEVHVSHKKQSQAIAEAALLAASHPASQVVHSKTTLESNAVKLTEPAYTAATPISGNETVHRNPTGQSISETSPHPQQPVAVPQHKSTATALLHPKPAHSSRPQILPVKSIPKIALPDAHNKTLLPQSHERVIEPLTLPPLPPLQPLAPVAPASPIKTKPTLAEQLPQIPAHHTPAWQSGLTATKPKSHNDEPADMFELAQEHPESFGSSQLYEEELKERDADEEQKK